MHKLSVDDIVSGRKSRYSLVIAVAKRARQIVSESEETGEILVEKPVNIAIKDFKEHKYAILEPEVND